MSDVVAYAGAFVVLEPSEITLNDPDEDGDLDKYTQITITYTPTGGKEIEWPVISVTPLTTKMKDATGNSITIVNSVVLLVVPKLPPPGCLGRFLPLFPKSGKRQNREQDDPPTTGGLMGTLVQGGPAIHGVTGKKKTFTLDDPLIFYGVLA